MKFDIARIQHIYRDVRQQPLRKAKAQALRLETPLFDTSIVAPSEALATPHAQKLLPDEEEVGAEKAKSSLKKKKKRSGTARKSSVMPAPGLSIRV